MNHHTTPVYIRRDNYKIGKTSGNFSRCIIDVGCFWTGEKGKHYKKQFNVPCIFIDADQLALEKLSVDPNDLVIMAAVSSKPGLGCFHLYREACHSLNEINFDDIGKLKDGFTGKPVIVDDWKLHDVRYVPKITLESLIADLDIQEVAVLKIDAQGHDLEVVKGLGSMIDRVNHIELEVSTTNFEIYKQEHKKQEVDDYLTLHGFHLIRAISQTYGQEENLIFRKRKLG
jgi:FkbM family methyltransferase